MLGYALIVFSGYRESTNIADLIVFLLKNKISPIITTPEKLKETFLDVKNAFKNMRVPILYYRNSHMRIDLPTQILRMLINSQEYNSVVNTNNEVAAFMLNQTELKNDFNINDPFLIKNPFITNIRIKENTDGYLVYDGERVVPDAPAALASMKQHLTYYDLFIPYTTNAIVADIACGCGYGTFEIAKHAKQVIGMDIDDKAVNYAARNYKKDNLQFKTGISSDLPKNFFDIVTSVETFEHIESEDIQDFIQDIHSALKVKGSWMFTTPNGDMIKYNPKTKAERVGSHIKHYTENELKEMLSCFQNISFIKKTDIEYAVLCKKI